MIVRDGARGMAVVFDWDSFVILHGSVRMGLVDIAIFHGLAAIENLTLRDLVQREVKTFCNIDFLQGMMVTKFLVITVTARHRMKLL
jgi:hypothetical protein